MPNVKATKALQKRSDAALESFHKYYADIWGEERWHCSLFPALGKATRYCVLVNKFAHVQDGQLPGQHESDQTLETISLRALSMSVQEPLVLCKPSDGPFPQPIPMKLLESEGTVLSHWSLDFASVLATCMLQVRPGDKVLDLCAAPGGKSIVLAQMLWPNSLRLVAAQGERNIDQTVTSSLHANENDLHRHKRLASNLRSYLPSSLLTENAVKVLRIDGSEKSAAADLPLGEGGYDRVLLDAPCSSERHILHAYLSAASAGQICEEMANWKSSHSKTLAKTQAALLMTAIKSVKVGGHVLYATCSISMEENDDVIERTLETIKRWRKREAALEWRLQVDKTYDDSNEARTLLNSLTERTKCGRILLPDHPTGGRWGPLYFCLLRKVPSKSRAGIVNEGMSMRLQSE